MHSSSINFGSLFIVNFALSRPGTHTKRQATRHGCLPSLLGDEDIGIEIVYGEEKIFCTEPSRAAKAGPKSLVPAQAQQTNQEMMTMVT
jgi:hypothetical protein